MSESIKARWINRGFDPERHTHEYYGCFTKSEAQASLFETTRFDHKLVYLTNEEEHVHLPIVIDLARPLYLDDEIGPTSPEPNWYFEAWVFEPGVATIRRVRIYVATMDYSPEFTNDDIFTWQWIEQPLNQVPLSTPLRDIGPFPRVYNLLKNEGVHTVGDLVKMTADDVLDIRNIGPTGLECVRTRLADAGYWLAP